MPDARDGEGTISSAAVFEELVEEEEEEEGFPPRSSTVRAMRLATVSISASLPSSTIYADDARQTVRTRDVRMNECTHLFDETKHVAVIDGHLQIIRFACDTQSRGTVRFIVGPEEVMMRRRATVSRAESSTRRSQVAREFAVDNELLPQLLLGHECTVKPVEHQTLQQNAVAAWPRANARRELEDIGAGKRSAIHTHTFGLSSHTSCEQRSDGQAK